MPTAFARGVDGAPDRPCGTTLSIDEARIEGMAAAPTLQPRRTEPRARTVLYPFQIGVPAVDVFPIGTWSRVLGRHSRSAQARELAHSDSSGDRALREAIAAHLAVARGVVAHADQVMITGGYHSALGLMVRALAKPDDEAWVEDPGYHRARAALSLAGLRLAAVPVDAEGLDVAQGVAHTVTPAQLDKAYAWVERWLVRNR